MNRLTIIAFLLTMLMMNIVHASSTSKNKRSCSAYGERCETALDCCHHETDHCIGCFHRVDLIVKQFGKKRCGCQSTSSMVIGHPERGRCNGYDRRARQCRHRYD